MFQCKQALKAISYLVLLLIIIPFLSSCKKNVEIVNEIKTVKLMMSSQGSYQTEFQGLLDFKFPQYEFEIVPSSRIHQAGVSPADYVNFIQEHAPDILLLPEVPGLFPLLSEQGVLLDLEPYITRDHFDLSGMLPSIIDHVRNQGYGRLYGLTTGFHSQGLFYNTDLFDSLHIDYPRHQMSYEELLELAQRFPFPEPDEPVFGFHQQSMRPSSLLLTIGEVGHLQWLDESEPRITMDSAGWRNILSILSKTYQQGSIFDSTLLEEQLRKDADPKSYQTVVDAAKQRNLFTSGHAAMTIHGHTMLRDIQSFAPEMNWGVATVPVDPMTPQQTFSMRPGQIYSLYAGSTVLEEAWDVFRFIHGEEMALMKSRTEPFGQALPIRTALIPHNEQGQLEGLYLLGLEERIESSLTLPLTFHSSFREAIDGQITALVQNRIGIEEAIAYIQEQGNRALQAALAPSDR